MTIMAKEARTYHLDDNAKNEIKKQEIVNKVNHPERKSLIL